ncbi:MAG: hypothetical protein J5854_02910 [Clostridia bacterium]|nr:hypothetical protein [Clostridia bacterium]
MNTKIITIEGIDGSGKTVQFRLLKEYLLNAGHSVASREFPVYESFFGKQVGKLLSGEEGVLATDVDQKSMALWYALDRWESFRDYRPGETDFLLMNRYVLSNAVYQSIRERDLGKPDIMDWVFDLEYGHFGLPRPDLNIFFDVNAKRAGQNVDRKGFRDYVGSGRDVYEKSFGMQERAREMYLEAAERYDDIAVIGCMEDGAMRAPEAILESVIGELQNRKIL